MTDIFTPNETKKHTRNSQLSLKVPLRKSNKGQNALSYMAPYLWNKLSIEVKLAKTRNEFKHRMKLIYLKMLENKTRFNVPH